MRRAGLHLWSEGKNGQEGHLRQSFIKQIDFESLPGVRPWALDAVVRPTDIVLRLILALLKASNQIIHISAYCAVSVLQSPFVFKSALKMPMQIYPNTGK